MLGIPLAAILCAVFINPSACESEPLVSHTPDISNIEIKERQDSVPAFTTFTASNKAPLAEIPNSPEKKEKEVKPQPPQNQPDTYDALVKRFIYDEPVSYLPSQFVESTGDVIMLHIYASWCGPCEVEFPGIIETVNKYSDRGLTIIAISLDYSNEDLINFMKVYPAPFKSYVVDLEDPKEVEKFAIALGAVGAQFSGYVPYTAFYDRNGAKVIEWSSAYPASVYEKVIQQLIQ